MSCVSDDLAKKCENCTCKYKTVAVIPALGRFTLLKATVERLYKVNGIYKVIIVGHEPQVQKIARETDSIFVQHRNNPLGHKWNIGFKEAEKLNPDAVLFVGSSDWVSSDWLKSSLKHLPDYDLIGKLGCHFLDINTITGKRLVYWPGYPPGRREREPIGIGRIISARILDKINWEPFDEQRNNSMDSVMYHRVLAKGGRVKILRDEVFSMSISTNKWPNKHRFEDHYNNILPSKRIEDVDKFLKENFPDSLNLNL